MRHHSRKLLCVPASLTFYTLSGKNERFFFVGLANFPTLQKSNHKTGRKTVDTTTDNNDTLPYIFRSVGKCATKACTIFKWATFVSKNSKWLCLSRVSDFAKNFLAVFCGFEFSIQKWIFFSYFIYNFLLPWKVDKKTKGEENNIHKYSVIKTNKYEIYNNKNNNKNDCCYI